MVDDAGSDSDVATLKNPKGFDPSKPFKLINSGASDSLKSKSDSLPTPGLFGQIGQALKEAGKTALGLDASQQAEISKLRGDTPNAAAKTTLGQIGQSLAHAVFPTTEELKKGVETSALGFIPDLKVNDSDSPTIATGKEAANLLLGIPKFLTTPEGVGSLATGAIAPKVIASLFTAQSLDSLGKQVIQTNKDWDKYTPAQQSKAILDMVGSGEIALGSGGLALKNDVKPFVEPNVSGKSLKMPEGALPIQPKEQVGEIGKQMGFTYDGIHQSGEPNGEGDLSQFTFRNVPKENPEYGATFYLPKDATPEQILNRANEVKSNFASKSPASQPPQPASETQIGTVDKARPTSSEILDALQDYKGNSDLTKPTIYGRTTTAADLQRHLRDKGFNVTVEQADSGSLYVKGELERKPYVEKVWDKRAKKHIERQAEVLSTPTILRISDHSASLGHALREQVPTWDEPNSIYKGKTIAEKAARKIQELKSQEQPTPSTPPPAKAGKPLMPNGWSDVKKGETVYVDGKPVKVEGYDNHGRVWTSNPKTGMHDVEITGKFTKEPPSAAEPEAQHVGMGAAVPSEFENNLQTSTSIKNATVDQERIARGLPPAMKAARRSFGEVWDTAMAKIDQDPTVTQRLVDSLRDKPRALTDVEDALLLHRQIELQNEYGKLTRDLAQAHDDATEFPNRLDDVAELKNRVAGVSDALLDIYDIGKASGSETGRGLNARKMMANEDYSLAQMEVSKRAANGGKPLTESQTKEIQDLHDQIAKTQKAYDDYVANTQARISELEANKATAEILKTAAPIEPHIRIIADKIISVLDKQGNAALNRIRARRREGRLMANLDPTDLADHAIYGASKFGKGAIEFGKWSAEMLTDLGDYVKPHLKQIWEATQKQIDKTIEGAVSPFSKEKVKRAVKSLNPAEQKDRIQATIRKRIEAGKKNEITPQIQKLARIFVEQGIKTRDALIDAVHEVLKGIDPEITRRDTMDAISGYGDFKPITKDKISVELRDLKGQMQQVAKLEDMQAGQPPLKTGVERRIPTKEESRLIKLVNDAKRKFQIPITDPNTQLRSSLDELKKRMQTRTDELEKKLTEGDFAPRPRPEPVKLDSEGLRLKAANERAKQAFNHGLNLDRLKNRTTLEKIQDTFVRWRRGFLLSSPVTLAKLTAAAIQRMAITPFEEAVGAGYSKLLPKIASKAPREGGFNSKAESKSISQAITQGMKDSWDTLRTGQSQLDVLFGQGREGYVSENFVLPRSVVDFFGHIHGALKAPVKRAEFTRSLEKRTEQAIRNGVDISDPLVQTRLMVESYKDANRSIFLQNNGITSAYRAAVRTLEQKDKVTGRVPVGRKVIATGLKIALPIVKVPTNIIAETFQYALGTITGGARLTFALRRGVETLKPEEADLILRELKKGSIGAAVLLLGYFNPDLIGGYYQQGQKRKEGDVKYGSIKLFGHSIPSFLLHNPLLETLQVGATIRRVADSKLHKKDKENQGLTNGLIAGGLGLTEEVPFVNDTLQLTKVFNPYERGQFWGEYAKSLVVPQLFQFIANQQDKDSQGNVVKRNPTTTLQHIETGIPVLRKNVPVKNKK